MSKANEALDKMAENARELGLDYEPAQQEPVAWMDIDENDVHSGLRYWSEPDNRHEVALYTSPPASKPLTDEQIMEMYNEPRSDAEMLEFARAIEAAHGIKGDA